MAPPSVANSAIERATVDRPVNAAHAAAEEPVTEAAAGDHTPFLRALVA